jgi:hypothetical protein
MALGGLVASAFVAVGFMLVGPSRESTGPDAAAPPPSTQQATSPVLDTRSDPSRGDADRPVAVAPALGAEAKSNPTRSNSVTRKGADVAMSFEGIPLAEAVASLSAATGGRVHGSANLAAVTSLVTLRWHGSGLEAAWSALLSPVVNSAVACGPQACDVWIVGIRDSAGGARLPEPVGIRDRTTMDPQRGSPVIAALPIDAPAVPRARRNDGALEAPSSD